MSHCYGINSDGRFLNEIGKDRCGDDEELSVTSFSRSEEGKATIDLLFEVLDAYEKSSVALSNAIVTYTEATNAVGNYSATDFWTVYSRSGTACGQCYQCGRSFTASYMYQEADYCFGTYEQFQKVQHIARATKLTMPPKFFRRDVVRTRCNQFVRSFLENMPGNEETTRSAILCETRDTNIAAGNVQIRALFQQLLGHKRATAGWRSGTTTLRAYVEDVEQWLLYAGSMLLRRAAYSDHLFLLKCLLATEAPSSWGGEALIQFPTDPELWHTGLVDHYLQMFHIATGFGLMPPQMLTTDSIAASFGSVAALDAFAERSAATDAIGLPDTDIAAILCQFNVLPFLTYITATGEAAPEGDAALRQALALRLLLFLRIVIKATMTLKRAKAVCTLLTYAVVVLNRMTEMCCRYSSNNNSSNDGGRTPLWAREHVECAVLGTAYAIVHSGISDAWSFLSHLPLYFLGERASWAMLSVLHMFPATNLKTERDEWADLVHPPPPVAATAGSGGGNAGGEKETDGSDPDLAEWVVAVGNEIAAKPEKADNSTIVAGLVEAARTADSLRYAIIAIGTLSENCDGVLVRACMESLFRIVFASGVIDVGVAGLMLNFFESVCSKDISCISDLVRLLPLGFGVGAVEAPLYLKLVDSVPFGDWEPSAEDARTVASWANADFKTPMHQTARRIVDAVQWAKASIPANRAAARAIVRATAHRHGIYKDKFVKIFDYSTFNGFYAWATKTLSAFTYYAVGVDGGGAGGGEEGGQQQQQQTQASGCREDSRELQLEAEDLHKRLNAAAAVGKLDSVLKKTEPEELFALFMLTPLGADAGLWVREWPLVLQLLKTLIDGSSSGELKTPVFCQLVPYVFGSAADKEALKKRVIPDYSDVICSYIRGRAGFSFTHKLDYNKANLICRQLISAQIDTYPLDVARSFGDFWLKVATYRKKWFSDIPTAAILSVFLESWFALKDGALPLPAYEATIASHIGSWVTAKSISMLPLKAYNIIFGTTSLVNFPYFLFETLCKIILIIIITLLFSILFTFFFFFLSIVYETKYLLEHKVLKGDVLAKKARQWALYTAELPATCDIGLLFWQVTVHLYDKAITDPQCSASALKPLFRDRDRKHLIERLEAYRVAAGQGDAAGFYAALEDYFEVAVRKVQEGDRSAISAAAAAAAVDTKPGSDQRNWVLVTVLRTSPFDYAEHLLLPYIGRTAIAQKIRGSLAREVREVKRRYIRYDRPTYAGALDKCKKTAGRPAAIPDFSPSNREAVWNSGSCGTIVLARETGMPCVYGAMDDTVAKDLAVDSSIEGEDNEYGFLVRKLYIRVNRSDSQYMFCGCGNTVTISYNYTTSIIDNGVADQITQNRRRVFRLYEDITLLSSDAVDRVVLLDDTTHKLLLIYAALCRSHQSSRHSGEAGNNKSKGDDDDNGDEAKDDDVEVPEPIVAYAGRLYDEVLDGLERRGPGFFYLFRMLKHIIFELTQAFVRTNYVGALGVLELMLKDASVGRKVAPFYTPWVVRNRFILLLRHMLGAYARGNTLHERILSSFDLYEWARIDDGSVRRSLAEKKAVLAEVATAFPRCGADAFLCSYVVGAFDGALRESFPALLLPALGLFVPQPRSPAAQLWDVLARQNMTRADADTALSVLRYISSTLGELRAAEEFHYKAWSSTFGKFLGALTAQQVGVAAAAATAATATTEATSTPESEASVALAKTLFAEALGALTPCLDAVGPHSPWERSSPAADAPYLAAFSGALALLAQMAVGAVQQQQQNESLGTYFVAEVWRYVTETLGTLGTGHIAQETPRCHIQDALFDALARVPWEAWVPPKTVFRDVIAMSCEHMEMHAKAPAFARFMVSFGTAVTWRDAEYYTQDTLLELHYALTRSLALYPEPVPEVVYTQVHRLNPGRSSSRSNNYTVTAKVEWDLLSEDTVKSVMDESIGLLVHAPRHRDEIFKWYVLYVYIAQTCGIKLAPPSSASAAQHESEDNDNDDHREYYADVLTSGRFGAFVDYFAALQQQPESVCPGLLASPVDAILCAYKGFFDGNAGTLESVNAAIGRLFYLYNYPSAKNTDIHNPVVRFLQRCPECSCLFAQHACRCISKSARLLPILEDFLTCYFSKYDDWAKVSRFVSVPATETAQSFVNEALVKSFYLSFFAIFRSLYDSRMYIYINILTT